jgi:hypothetical protein
MQIIIDMVVIDIISFLFLNFKFPVLTLTLKIINPAYKNIL